MPAQNNSGVPRVSGVSLRLLSLVAVAPAGGQAGLSLTQAAEAATRAAEEEATRRRHMAGEYAASLRHQLKLLHQDLLERQEQWASFCSALMEAQQLLKAPTGSRSDKPSPAGQNSEGCGPANLGQTGRREMGRSECGRMRSQNWPKRPFPTADCSCAPAGQFPSWTLCWATCPRSCCRRATA